jgi:hypothetical protein
MRKLFIALAMLAVFAAGYFTASNAAFAQRGGSEASRFEIVMQENSSGVKLAVLKDNETGNKFLYALTGGVCRLD